ncbi:MAG: aromatic ring-hydroxylating dioxygenase subunit alpha [Rhizobiales bacterium]|nr:aromatic ring-hydroxylating dioxygenase subunit alpha [Hyphomicrobiales bacterium]MBI3672451.1 aromatic ring-hydroxylating dioxygenase subunit alpha [Hyphomicrobiales bacterium]
MQIATGKQVSNDWDRRGLPAWTYHNANLLELEKTELFLGRWQIAGHINDVPAIGDYLTFDVCDDRAVIVRGDDGVIRAFHNLCRHRGSRVAVGDTGHCKNALVCPFHGWVYNLDGTLRGAARPNSYAALDRSKMGLRPIEMEVWMGFIFVRFRKGPQPSVAEHLARFESELAPYRPAEMVPTGKMWKNTLPVNWKSVRDVDNEGYHVPMAHPALQDLYGPTYHDIDYPDGLNCAKGYFVSHGGRRWTVRNYLKLAGGLDWLPEDRRKVWAYYGLFPNSVIIATPETVQFYQELPMAVDRALVRGMIYRRPDEAREQKLARYLSYRIDRETYEEDTQLSIWSNESMKSSAFEGFYLSDLERGVRTHHDRLRQILPVVTLDQAPAGADMAALNARLRARMQS